MLEFLLGRLLMSGQKDDTHEPGKKGGRTTEAGCLEGGPSFLTEVIRLDPRRKKKGGTEAPRQKNCRERVYHRI